MSRRASPSRCAADPSARVRSLLGCQRHRGTEPDDPGHIVCPAAQLAFLSSPVQDGSQGRAAAAGQHSDPLGSTQLVAAHSDQIGVGGRFGQIQPGRGLDSVGMQKAREAPAAAPDERSARRVE